MDHLPNRYVQFYQYVLELFPIWIVIYFFHMQQGLGASAISFFGLAIIAYAVSTYAYLKSGKSMILAGGLLMAGLAFLLGYDFMLIVFMTAVLVFRIESHLLKPDQDYEEAILITTLITSIVAYQISFSNEYPYANNFLVLAAAFLFTFLLGRFLLYYLSDPDGTNSVGKKKTIWFISIGAVLFFGTYLLTFIFPYIRVVLGYIIYGVLTALAWIVSPLVQLTEYINISPPEPIDPESNADFSTGLEQRETDTSLMAQYLEWILLGIGSLVFLLVLYLLFRYRKNLSPGDASEKEHTITVKKSRTSEHRFWKRKQHKAPQNPIRKAYYQLEKWAADQEMGRYQHETIDEWLDRQQIYGKERQQVIKQYEKVRYADENQENQLGKFKEDISSLKELLKKQLGEKHE